MAGLHREKTVTQIHTKKCEKWVLGDLRMCYEEKVLLLYGEGKARGLSGKDLGRK